MAPGRAGGVYGFARHGFGDYIGFTSAWGYWFSTWTGSVGVRDHKGDPRRTHVLEILLGVVAMVFAVFLLYAAGFAYLLVAAIAFLLGTVLYAWARRERGLPIYSRAEQVVFAVVTVAALVGVWQLAAGNIAVT